MILIYVAGAYSGDTVANTRRAEVVSIELIKRGFAVITPHKNTFGYEKYEGERTIDGGKISYRTWIMMDLELVYRSDAVCVVPNSEKSKGTQKEIRFAMRSDIPVYYDVPTLCADFNDGVHHINEFTAGGKKK